MSTTEEKNIYTENDIQLSTRETFIDHMFIFSLTQYRRSVPIKDVLKKIVEFVLCYMKVFFNTVSEL